MPVCYRHTSRETGVSCSNCGRPICPDCMTPTSVGMRCPECAGERTKVVRVRAGMPGAGAFSNAVLSDPRTWGMTHILIFVNVLVFLAEVATGVSLSGTTDHGWVLYHGVLVGPALTAHNPYPAPFNGNFQLWRLVTSGFLHESILHIGMNMFSLWFVGRSLEPAIGKKYFAAIYFTALLAGSFGAVALTPDQATLGASGAIFGVFGALIMLARARHIPLWQSGLVPILLLNLVFTLSVQGVSIGGHAGGVLSGFATGWLYTEYAEKRNKSSYLYAGCVVIAIASVIGAVLLGGSTGLLPNGSNINI